jgi:hypothetical protein
MDSQNKYLEYNSNLDISYMKYLKYKEKYINLKKMLGGDLRDDVIENTSDEDLVKIPVEFFDKLRNIYPSCKHDHGSLNDSYNGHVITYGEMEYPGMKNILDHVHKIDKFNNFIDLGSGRGKLPLYVAGLPNISKSIGIELVKERHDDALEIKNKLEEYQHITDKVIFINDDFFNVDLSKHINNNKTLIWLSNLCFPQELNNKIFNKLVNILPSGSIIACSKEHLINSDKINNIGKLQVPMSWNKNSTIFLYKIQ